MALFKNAGEVTRAVLERLALVKPAGGYHTDLKGVYGPTDSVKDNAPTPYVLVRPAADAAGGLAGRQVLRNREYEIEGVFSKAAPEGDLAAFHVDVLRALGIGQDLPERQFPGLLDAEGDEAAYRWGVKGESTHSVTIRLGVQYVQTYN